MAYDKRITPDKIRGDNFMWHGSPYMRPVDQAMTDAFVTSQNPAVAQAQQYQPSSGAQQLAQMASQNNPAMQPGPSIPDPVTDAATSSTGAELSLGQAFKTGLAGALKSPMFLPLLLTAGMSAGSKRKGGGSMMMPMMMAMMMSGGLAGGGSSAS